MPPQSIAMPICELCDRLTIAKLKLVRLPESEINKNLLQKQIDYYQSGIDNNLQELKKMIDDLFIINSKMWDAEYEIRKGLDDQIGFEEIGKRAIVIRNLNRERVAIKNQITQLVNQPEFSIVK